MHLAVILAHPDPASVNAHLARACVRQAQAMGHQATLRDLYASHFDPCLPICELPWRADYAPRDDVIAERKLLATVDVFVFVYPLWFNAPPAILKGWVDRVFSLGFGFHPAEGGGNAPGLKGRSLLSVTTSGAPDNWVAQTGALDTLRQGFDAHVAAVCGLTVLDHINFGGVVTGIRPDAVDDMANTVGAKLQALLATPSSVPG